jgi:putative hydrolase of the HAD superfamily
VNAALEAGIHAVFVPHERTWTLERAELREGPGRLIQVTKFEELREYF